MDTALFLFGLKMHRQENHVKFFDADFLNFIKVKSELFHNSTLGDCCKMVNEALYSSGFSGSLFEVGKLNEIEDFDLSEAMVGNHQRMHITLRFNSFAHALEAHLALSNYVHSNAQGTGTRITSKFFEPAPLYFDGRFSTKFEGCIKGKFAGLDQTNEISSDYVKRRLRELGIHSINRFAQSLNDDPSLQTRQ